MNESAENEKQTIEEWLAEQDALGEESPKPMTVLQEAEDIIYGEREMTYGHPAKNLRAIADFWTTYVESASNGAWKGLRFTPKDVALMMILVKTARLANNDSHRDSVVDICGYAALMERCDEGIENEIP